VTWIVSVPVAPALESVPVIVTVPVVLPSVPVLPLVMLMIAELLEENVVDPVTLLLFNVAAKVTVEPAGFVVRLIGLTGLEVTVSCVEVPAVSVIVPETTLPFVDSAAACTVTAVPGVVTVVAVASPGEVVLMVMKPVGLTLQVAFPVRFLVLPSS
jgi:hypothetical protein